jgi:hypothetical protein
MNPWAIPVIMSVFGAYLGYKAGGDQKDYARKQEDLAERNEALGRRELEEKLRRQGIADMRLRASALARGAASGAEGDSGTNAVNAAYMLEEQTRQLNWMETAGASEIRLQLESDMLRADMTKTGGENQQWSSIIQGAMGAFAFADKGGMMDWGGTTPVSTGHGSTGGISL